MRSHPEEVFIFGPYASVQAGNYDIEFLGEMDDEAAANFDVTIDNGERRCASIAQAAPGIATREMALLPAFPLPWMSPRPRPSFSSSPTRRTGLIRSRGVRVTWRPLRS